jgi:hypothetical protein
MWVSISASARWVCDGSIRKIQLQTELMRFPEIFLMAYTEKRCHGCLAAFVGI